MTVTIAQQKAVKHIPEYDGVRGIAIIMVIAWHYINNLIVDKVNSLSKFVLLLTSRCWSGVDLFFVLSGFLLGGILLRNRESKNYFITFYVRRICRIFPLYYFYLFVYFLLFNTQLAQNIPWVFDNTLPFWGYACFAQNFLMAKYKSLGSHAIEPTWSLAVEEQFYLLLPFIIYFLRGRVLLILIGVMSAAALYFRLTAPNWYASFSLLHCRADALLLGVLVAYFINDKQTSGLLIKQKNALYILFYCLFFLFFMLTFGVIRINYYVNFSFQAFFFALFLLLISIDKNSKMVYFLQNKTLGQIGKYSFGIYIYHYFILGIVHYLVLHQAPQLSNITNLLVTLLALAILYMVAVLSYHLFEKKFIAWGQRHVY